MKNKLTLLILSLLLAACGAQTVPTATIDPFVAVEQAQRTAQAAQEEADFYSSQLTATAQAPLIALTATAGAWEMQMQFAAATAQAVQATETAVMTQTAMSWTPTPNPTQTAAALAYQAEATTQAQALKVEELKVERAQTTNTMRAMSGYVFGFVFLLIATMFAVTFAKRFSILGGNIDSTGKPVPVINVIDGTVVDVDRLANGAGQATGAWVKALPAITAARQDVVTNHAQMVDLETRAQHRLPANLVKEQGQKLLEAPAQLSAENEALFPLPSWELINGWEPNRNKLPYGLTSNGLGLVDVTQFPHLATIGATGTGKSRRFMRPIIAAALAAGHRVVIVGKATDYTVFDGHPNARIIKVNQMTDSRHAALYAQVLQHAIEEMNRRDDKLASLNKSTWEQAGFGRTFLVLDELGNAMRLMPSSASELTRIWVEGLVAEGRKVGFSVMLANQRATGMATILSQTAKAIFRVERDEEKAHRSLNGASGLKEGYFFMRAGVENIAGAFEPTDAQIASFLSSRRVAPIEPESWLEGITIQASLPDAQAQPVPTPTNEAEEKKSEIIAMLEEGETPSGVVRILWGVNGGDRWRKLKAQVESIRENYITARLTSEGI